MDALRIGSKVYCSNFDQYGVVTGISADTVDTIVNYVDDNMELHKVYAHMVEKVKEDEK